MPVVIKVKRPARRGETNLSCWSYYSQIKLSCLGRPGCKLQQKHTRRSPEAAQPSNTGVILFCVCVCVFETMPEQHVETLWWENTADILST